jgi:hypothetical protein
MAPPPSYIPIIGNDNLVSVKMSDGTTPLAAGTIAGAAVLGRPGSMKTSLLVAMQNALSTTAAVLFYVEVACPAGFSTPLSNAADFNYSQLLPVVSAAVLAESFSPGGPPDSDWPATLDDFTGFPSPVSNVTQVAGRLSAATPPSSAHPYGSLTYEFSGASMNSTISGSLICATIDFSSSSSN